MASLTGQSISTTYDSLLKLTDNGPITASFKEITDGLGNSSGVFVKSTGQIKLGNYITTTSFTGTAAGYLAFTSAGEIITTAIPSGGITSLNALTASTQTFAVGTSGTDFAISSATSTHTFNLPTASAANRGALSSADWTTFNGKVATTRTISTTAPLSGGGDLSADRTLTISQATTSTDGYLSSTNWNTFNSKESALTFSSPLSRTTNTISIPAATTSVNGYLTSTDWTTFNNKQALITGGATTIVSSNLTVSRALVSDGSGKVAVATTTSTEIGYVNGVTSAIQTQLDTKAPKLNTFNRVTASYTLVLGDAGKIIETNVAGANTLTIPTNASVAFPIGTEIQVLQYNEGQTTIAGAGVTLRSKLSQLKIANKWTGVTLVKVGTDEWYVIGNLSA